MKVAVLERPARWGNPAQALVEVEPLLGDAELVLLPELALTGYVSPAGDFDVTPFAEPLDGPTATEMQSLARRRGVHLVGPLVERNGDRVYNSMVGFAPDGRRILHYRKRHPWLPENWATPGKLPYPLVEIGDLLVTLAICYDIHFLGDEAARELEAADLLLFPSAWVERGEDSRPALFAELRDRFGVAVANANWGPGARRISGQGGSAIVTGAGRFDVVGGRVAVEIARKLAL